MWNCDSPLKSLIVSVFGDEVHSLFLYTKPFITCIFPVFLASFSVFTITTLHPTPALWNPVKCLKFSDQSSLVLSRLGSFGSPFLECVLPLPPSQVCLDECSFIYSKKLPKNPHPVFMSVCKSLPFSVDWNSWLASHEWNTQKVMAGLFKDQAIKDCDFGLTHILLLALLASSLSWSNCHVGDVLCRDPQSRKLRAAFSQQPVNNWDPQSNSLGRTEHF